MIEKTYQHHPDVLQTDLQTELVLIHGRTGHSYRLNGTARLLWQALPATSTELVQCLMQAYAVSEISSQDDVATMLDHLIQADLIVFSS